MADEEKKILIDVNIANQEAIKRIADLKKQIADLKSQQKQLDLTTEEGRQQYEVYNQQIAALSTESRKYQKEIQNNIKQQNAEAGSINALKAQLALMTEQYNAMGKEMQSSDAGKALAAQMLETSNALKEAEGNVGNFTRNVGDYRNAITDALRTGNPFIDNLVKMGTTSGGLKDTFAMLKSGVQGFGKALLSLLSNPIVMIVAGIVVAFKSLYDMFKEFDPVMDAIEQGMAAIGAVFSTLKETVFGVITGQKNLKDAFLDSGAAMRDAAAAAIEMKKAQQELDDLTMISTVNQEKYKNQIDELMLQARNRTLSEEERIALLNKAQEIDKQAFEERKKMSNNEVLIAQNAIISKHNLTKEEIKNLKEKGVAYAISLKETKKITDGEIQALADALVNRYRIENESIKLREKSQNLEDKLAEQQEEKAQKAAEERKKRIQEQQDLEIRNQQTIFEIEKAKLNASEEAYSTDFKTRQAFALKLFTLEENSAKATLALQKKYGRITSTEYNNQLALLETKRKDFANKQLDETNKEFQRQADELKNLLGKGVEDQISEVENQFNNAIDDLNNLEKPNPLGMAPEEYAQALEDYEEMVVNAGELQLKLEKEKNDKIKKIRKAAEIATGEDIKKIIEEQYGGDLEKYQDNVRKKLEIEIQSLEETIKLRKEAGLTTYNEEAALRKAKSDLLQSNLNFELAQSNLSADEIYKKKKEALEKERELYAGNAEKQMEIDAQLQASYAEMMNAKTEAFLQWSDATLSILGSLSEAMAGQEQKQLDDAKKANDEKKKSLDARLKAGKISQEQYDKAIADGDAKLAKTQAEIERKQAIRKRAMDLMQVAQNTAVGIMKTIGELGMPFAIPMIAVLGAIAAAQTAAIVSQPLPEAGEGMLINGKSHAEGGELILAEGGEVIINKKSAQMFLPELSMINKLGGGVPFTKPLSDGGFAVRSFAQGGVVQNNSNNEIIEAIRNLKVVATIEDIRRENDNYISIEKRATY